MGINAILAIAIFVTFYSGQLTLANAGFMAIGAYTTVIMNTYLPTPLPLAMLAGYAGALETHINFFIDPLEYSVTRTIQILTFAVVGGTTNVIGPIVGAVFLTSLPEIVRQFAAYRDVVNGVILILVIIFRPQGIVGRGGLAIIAPRWWTRWRTRERPAAAH